MYSKVKEPAPLTSGSAQKQHRTYCSSLGEQDDQDLAILGLEFRGSSHPRPEISGIPMMKSFGTFFFQKGTFGERTLRIWGSHTFSFSAESSILTLGWISGRPSPQISDFLQGTQLNLGMSDRTSRWSLGGRRRLPEPPQTIFWSTESIKVTVVALAPISFLMSQDRQFGTLCHVPRKFETVRTQIS